LLRTHGYRNLLLANLSSDIGTYLQTVGAAWLMVSLGAGPMKVALIQTATALPYVFVALPAGALGDIIDRRRLILAAEYWMLAAAVALAGITMAGAMSPWLLLALTFALAAGDACQAPSWAALLPDLVGHEDLPSASALNGIEFNFARALGPLLAGFVIAFSGVGAAFALNAVSFLAVIVFISRWKRPARQSSAPAETLGGATAAALRFVHHSPAIYLLLIRTGGGMFCASAILALLPVAALRMSGNPMGYGSLLALFGLGAILGAVTMPLFRTRYTPEGIATTAMAVLSISLLATGTLHSAVVLAPFLICGGAAWMTFISLVNTMVQQLAPAWVRARVMAVFLLTFQGSLALGSLAWGMAAEYRGTGFALVVAAIGTAASALLRYYAPLPDVDVDLNPWSHWRALAPVADLGYGINDGPVLITVEYRVEQQDAAAFIKAAHRLGRIRRRDGASRWGIFRDTEATDQYVETFVVNSWAEHLRQHERSVNADRLLEEAIRSVTHEPPVIRHLLYVSKER
jgi:MFS family permease